MRSWMTCTRWNKRKSEIICKDPSTLESILAKVPDLIAITPEKAFLLGAPLGDEVTVSEAIQEKITILRTMGDRLQHLHVHHAFLLLRHSIAMPKLLYILCSSPCFLSPALPEYDSVLRSVTYSLININLQDDDSAWLQASLPVNLGGLGIRSVGQLAPSAFLASAAASSNLANLILPSRLHIIP